MIHCPLIFHTICAVQVIREVMQQVLQPVMNDLNSLRGELTGLNEAISQQHETVRSLNETVRSLSETVRRLSGDLGEHKNQITPELVDLQTSFQSSSDSIPDAVLLILLPYLNNIEENLMTDLTTLISDRATSIDESVRKLSGDFDEHKNQTASELADLQASLNSELASLNSSVTEEFRCVDDQLAELALVHDHMRDDLSCVKTDLSSLNDSMNRVCDKVEEHEDHMTAELMELNEYLKENLTHQISSNDNLGVHTCGGTGGWRRVVYLDMTDPNTDCPSGWRETGYSKRTCGRASDDYYTCDSATFPVGGGEYSQVCGRIKAYQWGETQGFKVYI